MKRHWLFIGVPLIVLLIAGRAAATHKSWYLVDGGSNCQANFSSQSGSLSYGDGAVSNISGTGLWLMCPITMAGRFGSNGSNSFPMAEWALADHGTVWGYDLSTTDNVSCRTYALTASGGTYYGSSFSSSGTGAATLTMHTGGWGTWGGSLGTGNVSPIRTLGYMCWLPANSTIWGYRANICQWKSPATQTYGCSEL